MVMQVQWTTVPTIFEQQLDDGRLAGAGSNNEWSVPIVIPKVDNATGTEQQLSQLPPKTEV